MPLLACPAVLITSPCISRSSQLEVVQQRAVLVLLDQAALPRQPPGRGRFQLQRLDEDRVGDVQPCRALVSPKLQSEALLQIERLTDLQFSGATLADKIKPRGRGQSFCF